jgi:hypothetical protein
LNQIEATASNVRKERYVIFAKHLPPVITKRERLAAEILSHLGGSRGASATERIRKTERDVSR